MTKVLATNDEYVTLGVTDKDLKAHTDLRSVTYSDVFGTPHTVHVHKGGPFDSVEAILAAQDEGVLHAFESHEQASAFERDRGNTALSERLAALAHGNQPQGGQQQGGGY